MKEKTQQGSSKRAQRIDKTEREREMKLNIIYSHFHCVSCRSRQCFSEVWNRQRARATCPCSARSLTVVMRPDAAGRMATERAAHVL